MVSWVEVVVAMVNVPVRVWELVTVRDVIVADESVVAPVTERVPPMAVLPVSVDAPVTSRVDASVAAPVTLKTDAAVRPALKVAAEVTRNVSESLPPNETSSAESWSKDPRTPDTE